MRTFIKSCLLVMASGLAIVFSCTVMAESPVGEKDKVANELKKCKEECKSLTDGGSYEGCMIKCNETHKSKTVVISPVKK